MFDDHIVCSPGSLVLSPHYQSAGSILTYHSCSEWFCIAHAAEDIHNDGIYFHCMASGRIQATFPLTSYRIGLMKWALCELEINFLFHILKDQIMPSLNKSNVPVFIHKVEAGMFELKNRCAKSTYQPGYSQLEFPHLWSKVKWSDAWNIELGNFYIKKLRQKLI